jgi:hypothetical protein
MTGVGCTAVHEAGHAVIGRVLMLPCGSATAREDHDSAGHSVTADLYVAHHAWVPKVRVSTRWPHHYFHGWCEAEVALFGACGGLDTDDRVQIGLMLTELGRDANVEERLRRATRHLVDRHLATVSKVAQMLETKVSLSTEELDVALPNGAPLLRRPVITVDVDADELKAPVILRPPGRSNR